MITKIELKNFKIFEKEEFDLAPLTLITGINGMGKSSIIQSLLLLKQSFAIEYLQTQKKVDLSNDFVNLETAGDLFYGMADDTDRTIEIIITTDNSELHSWKIDAVDPKSQVLNCDYTGPDNWKDISLFSENFIFLDAERWGPRETYFKKEKRAYNTKLGIQGELAPAYLVKAISENEQLGIIELKNTSLKDSTGLYENLNAWVSEIMSLPLKAKVTELDESKIKLSYNIEGSKGQSYSALQVGFGLTFSLPIVLSILRAKKGDLIIIENPEAHLHPSAQIKIGYLLCLAAKNGVQVIIESHSDHILNSIRYAFHEEILDEKMVKIIFIRSIKTKDQNVPSVDYINLLGNGKLSHRPADFFDSWDKMLTKLL